MFGRLKLWAKSLRRDVLALWLAARDSRTPAMAKILAAAVAAYALSPVDLIPDFIPVLGYLDDLLIVPAGIWLTLRLIPGALLEELRAKASLIAAKPVSRAGLAFMAALWLLAAALLAMVFWPR